MLIEGQCRQYDGEGAWWLPDRPWNRKFLGFSFTRRDYRRKISLAALKRFKDRIREITTRTRGRSIRTIVQDLRQYLRGWIGYFGLTEARSVFK